MNRTVTYILTAFTVLYATSLVAQEADSITAVKRDTLSATRLDVESFITIDTISCIGFEADTISFNGADWSPLFQSMEQLNDTAQGEKKIVSVIHLGDSHVQAGFLTEALRIPMQKAWGNAGRGLITPLKITRTNEPSDYRFTTPDKWRYNRCIIGKEFSSRVGVGGILIEPVTESINLTIETMSRHGEDVKFNRLRLFHAPTDSFPQLLLDNEPDGLAVHSPAAGETCYSWDTLTNTISLKGKNSLEPANAAIYGAALENGLNGIIVHTIGNNSATYDCYNRTEEYGKKLASLAPQLVIISLGTNESVSSVFNRERLEQQIDCLIQSIKKESPKTLFLLTTPADNKLRKRRRNKRGRRVTYYVENPNLPLVTETIKDYGAKHNIAVWDWYTIAGGKGAYKTWIKEEGMRNDHIHYTPKGYTVQGNLLFQSILNAYEQHTR